MAGKRGRIHGFSVRFSAGKGLDLTRPPLNRDAEQWTHPTDYSHCQALADAARDAGVTSFAINRRARAGRTWRCWRVRRLHPESRSNDNGGGSTSARMGVRAICDFPEQRLAFDRAAFARDPRIAALNWDRVAIGGQPELRGRTSIGLAEISRLSRQGLTSDHFSLREPAKGIGV